jgi:hypothetical protein
MKPSSRRTLVRVVGFFGAVGCTAAAAFNIFVFYGFTLFYFPNTSQIPTLLATLLLATFVAYFVWVMAHGRFVIWQK